MRFASALNRAAAALSSIRCAYLVDLDFGSGHARYNDSGMNLEFGGNTYFGTGGFGSFDGVTEDIDGVAYGVRFELSGVDSGFIATIRTERYQGRPALLYIGLFNEANVFVDTPELVWSGYMDTMDLKIKGKTSVIELNCEHRVRAAPPVARWSDAEQKMLNPGDKFFEFTPFVSGYVSSWGGKATQWSYKPGGGYQPG
jgi:hypothetical protein